MKPVKVVGGPNDGEEHFVPEYLKLGDQYRISQPMEITVESLDAPLNIPFPPLSDEWYRELAALGTATSVIYIFDGEVLREHLRAE